MKLLYLEIILLMQLFAGVYMIICGLKRGPTQAGHEWKDVKHSVTKIEGRRKSHEESDWEENLI